MCPCQVCFCTLTRLCLCPELLERSSPVGAWCTYKVRTPRPGTGSLFREPSCPGRQAVICCRAAGRSVSSKQPLVKCPWPQGTRACLAQGSLDYSEVLETEAVGHQQSWGTEHAEPRLGPGGTGFSPHGSTCSGHSAPGVVTEGGRKE